MIFAGLSNHSKSCSKGCFGWRTPFVPAVVTAPVTSSPDSAPTQGAPSLELGGVAITPIGFLDFMQVWRSNVVSSGVAHQLCGIPFSNTVFGASRQTISSAANSRLGRRSIPRSLAPMSWVLSRQIFLAFNRAMSQPPPTRTACGCVSPSRTFRRANGKSSGGRHGAC